MTSKRSGHRAGASVSTAALAGAAAAFSVLAANVPVLRLEPSATAANLPLVGGLISQFPGVNLHATAWADSAFVASGVVALLAALAALLRAPRRMTTGALLVAAVPPCFASAVAWSKVADGPGSLSSGGTSLFEQFTRQTLLLLGRADVVDVHPAAGTMLLSAAAVCSLAALAAHLLGSRRSSLGGPTSP